MIRLLAVLGFVALLFSTACAMLTLLLAIVLTMDGSSTSPLALTAGILDVLGIGWVAYLLAGITFSDQNSAKRRTLSALTLLPSMLVASVAVSLTFATLVCVHLRSHDTAGTIFGSKISLINSLDFGFWAATIISQSLFIVLCFHNPTRHESATQESVMPQDLVDAILHTQQEPQDVPQPVPLRDLIPVPPIPQYARSTASSHSVSSFSSDGRSTIKSSFHGAVRPVTSRTRLMAQNSWCGPSSSNAVQSIPHQRHSSDPAYSSRRSSTDQSLSEAISRPHTPVKTRLETIPGSRANSPARALDGPFPNEILPEEADATRERSSSEPCADVEESTMEAESPVENPLENPIDESRIPPRFRKEPPPPRSTSPTLDQSFVHPLFRTDNPLPTPTATPGTTVIASAFGGRRMSPQSLSRMTTRSRTVSPEGVEKTVESGARAHSRPPKRFAESSLPSSDGIRAMSIEADQPRKALQDISGNASTSPHTLQRFEAVRKSEKAGVNGMFHIAIDNQ